MSTNASASTRQVLLAATCMLLCACGAGAARQSSGPLPPDLIFRTYVQPPPTYMPDPDPGRVKNILFATIPPDYYAARAAFFARNGVDGIMMNGLAAGWESDIWKQPNQFTPGVPAGRVVGKANPLLRMCRRMNARCRAAGIRYNSVKVHFSRKLPDWFDDAGWRQVAENFRQMAIFARDGGFAGISLDIEYIAETYELDYEAYQSPGYPRDRMRDAAARRGSQIVSAMLGAFPGMVFWLLPEWAPRYNTLGGDLFRGMVDAMAARKAPGGIHLSTEHTYRNTRPRGLMMIDRNTDLDMQRILRDHGTPRALGYWMCRGTMAIGLWPLGYGRPLYSASGEIVGYTGKNARFHGADVGPNADKSENYSPAEFRQQLAAARMLAQRFTWVYCHAGSTLWQMTPAEIRRYHGTVIDAVPVADNLNEFLRVMREKRIIDDPLFAQAAAAVRERRPFPQYAGFPAAWRILGPMPHDRASFADGVPAFDGASPAARTVKPGPGGYVDLTRLLGKQGTPLAWGVTACVMPRTRRVWVRIGSNDYGAVFVNGRRIYRVKEERPAAVDDDSVAVTLPAGRSTIAVACGDAGGSQWGFCVRVTDARGSAVPGLRWVRP